MAGVAEHFQQALQEPHRAEVVQLAPDPGAALGRRRDMRLAAEPGGERVGRRIVASRHRRTVGAQRLGERWGAHRDGGQPLLQEPLHRLVHGLLPAPGQARIRGGGVGFQGEQPGVQHRAQRTRRERRRPQRLTDPPVHGLQLVQRRLGLGDLHLRGGEPAAQGPLGEVPGDERLARAVLAAHRLERRAAAGHRVEVGVQRRGETLQAHRQQVQPVGRDGAPAQRVEDLAAPPGRDLIVHGRIPNCSRSRASSRMTVAPSASTRSTG